HFHALEVHVPGAPAADELVFILVMATGERIHQRVGGLRPEQISKYDGLRYALAEEEDMAANIRKTVAVVEQTRVEMGKQIEPATRRAVAMAVIENPYAGRYSENLDELIAIGEELGGLLGEQCVKALGIQPEQAESYGKAAIVGEAGELEHAAA